MNDQWMIRGSEFSNCNCAFGCPCQFNSPSTNGFCEAIGSAMIDEDNSCNQRKYNSIAGKLRCYFR